jgi:hypothetical protein
MPSDRSQKNPRRPPGLRSAGARLWKSVAGRFELEGHEHALLLEAARTVDRLDRLEAAIAAAGPLLTSGKPNPALVEARQQQIVLSRLLACLRIPNADGQAPQRRGAARGAYRGMLEQ